VSLKDVRVAANARLASLLPDYKELYDVFRIDENNARYLKKGYAVRWGRGIPAVSPTRKYGLNQSLIVSLTNSVEVRAQDNVAPIVDDLYETIDAVIASFLNHTYLGIPDKIRGINNAEISEPTLILGEKFVQIDIDFTVDFTIPINYN
jgi:hypothetical protein